MLKKLVNGVEIICSEEEERLIREKWALNDKYPHYLGHLMFDGISSPSHDMEECKKTFLKHLKNSTDKLLSDINNKIEQAQEMNDESSLQNLLAERKMARNLHSTDISHATKIQDLIDSIPSKLKEHWPK